MKKCGRCKEEKPLEAFGKKSAAKDGLQPVCGECNKAYGSSYYLANRDSEQERLRANKEKYFAINSVYVARLKTNTPCTDCDQKFPHPAMQFDHTGTDKEYTIGNMMYHYTLETVKREIAKCEIVCANCHAIRTHERDIRRRLPTIYEEA